MAFFASSEVSIKQVINGNWGFWHNDVSNWKKLGLILWMAFAAFSLLKEMDSYLKVADNSSCNILFVILLNGPPSAEHHP